MMKLDLREIIEIPGASLPYDCTLETDNLKFESVLSYTEPPHAVGQVRNSAGAMTLEGEMSAKMLCRCDRCMKQFMAEKRIPLSVPLAAQLTDDENADIFLLDGDSLNLSEVLEICFILEMDAKHLCREDCVGLCPTCGVDLNEQDCECRAETDPRLAVLEQLLDK